MSLIRAIKKKLGRRELVTAPSVITDESGALVRIDAKRLQTPQPQKVITPERLLLQELRKHEAQLKTERHRLQFVLRDLPFGTPEFHTCRVELIKVRAELRECREYIKYSSNAMH